MARFVQAAFGVVACCAALVAAVGPARAEEGEGDGSRILVFPLKGPAGAVVRNEIAKAIEPEADLVIKATPNDASRPARTARLHAADAMLGGRIRCPSKACVVDVIVYRPSGEIWTKGSKTTPRARLGAAAAELASSLLEEAGVLGQPEPEPEPPPAKVAPAPSDDEFDEGSFEEADDDDDDGERRERRRRKQSKRGRRGHARSDEGDRGHRLDAIEIYINSDITMVRNLCVDLNPALQNDEGCSRDLPTADDRTYSVSPFANLGFRLNVFPGAFSNRRAWWAGIGLYAEYGHSLSVRSQRQYETPEDPATGDYQTFLVDLDTSQQDLRIGLMYRLAIPPGSPRGPELRFMVGYGLYDYYINDADYPQDAEVRLRYRDSNPYLPAFRYHSIDAGLELRVPIRGFIFPYTGIFYRAGLGSGQAARIYGIDSSTNGVDWEAGVRVEVGYGIRFTLSTDLIWYGTTFAGDFAPENEEEALIWGGDIVPGDRSSDLVFRLRLGAGWSF